MRQKEQRAKRWPRLPPCADPASEVMPALWDPVLPPINDGFEGFPYFQKVARLEPILKTNGSNILVRYILRHNLMCEIVYNLIVYK